MKTKPCSVCRKELPIGEFRTRKTKAGNLTTRGPCDDCIKRMDRDRHRATRLEVLWHVSKGLMCCNCCKEKTIEFLGIDHVNNDGAKHRAECNISKIYIWLKSNGYPDGFQVLCHNCNLAKGFYGRCPHQHDT